MRMTDWKPIVGEKRWALPIARMRFTAQSKLPASRIIKRHDPRFIRARTWRIQWRQHLTGLFLITGHFFFFSSRRRHTIFDCDWSSDVCSSDLKGRADETCYRPVSQQMNFRIRRKQFYDALS